MYRYGLELYMCFTDGLSSILRPVFMVCCFRHFLPRRSTTLTNLAAGLSGLPQPQNEYQVMVPELPEGQDVADADAMEEDAADADARRKAVQKAREEAELRKRSQVER